MGLDMYLERVPKGTTIKELEEGEWRLIQTKYKEGNEISIYELFSPIKVFLVEEVIYWRKANQIHSWFVEKFGNPADNCKRYLVGKEHLEELLRRCRQVLEDRTLADELLPTQAGFFFGGTTYDDWYFKQLNETAEKLEKVLEETDFDESQFYYYAWW